MQNDILAKITCGFKTTKLNSFKNTKTKIMCLQFGKDKCVKIHIGKYHNPLICSGTEVEAWKDTIVITDEGKEYFQVQQFLGRMYLIKNYLGDIFLADTKSQKNIRDKKIWLQAQ